MKCTPKVRQKTFGVHFKMIFETASFIDYIIQDFCLRNTTMLTANKISIIPTALFTVKSSLNTKTPITTAVNGSIAPKMEVSVGPAYLITRVRDKDCVKNRVKRAKIVRFTLC